MATSYKSHRFFISVTWPASAKKQKNRKCLKTVKNK
jgi:hypothetical protein